MCHACVTETVKRRMLSRRDLFRATAAGAATAALGTGAAPAFAQAPSRVEDLTHTLHPDFPTYLGGPGVSPTRRFNFEDHGFNMYDLSFNEHSGTHIDAPIHFSADGQTVDEVPVENLVAPLVVVDIREKAAEDDEAQMTPDDLTAWMDENGELPARCCVAMLSGWAEHADGPKFRNTDGDGTMRFPGVHVEAAEMLLEQADCVGLAVDTLSLDIGSSSEFPTHYAWLPTNRWGLECVRGLERLPARGATLMVGAPKHRGGTGGPSRVVALV